MNVSPSNGGNVKIDQTVPATYPSSTIIAAGTTVTVEAIPADGYLFDGWSGDLTGQDNPTDIAMTCSKNITANFILKDGCRLTINFKGAGLVTPSAGIHDYVRGTVVNISATPMTGYQFLSWTGDVADARAASTTVSMDSDKIIVANFSGTAYTLTMETNGLDSVTPPIGHHIYVKGTVVDLIATVKAGYQFDGWTGEVEDPTSPNTTVTMDSDKTIIANFSRIMHSLTIEVKGAGSVKPSGHNMRYSEGSSVVLTATPDPDYEFLGWTGDVDDPSSANTRVTMNSEKTIVANFSGPSHTATHTLTIGIKGGGSVTPSTGTYTYTDGEIVPLVATPDDGWLFDGWTGDVNDDSATSIILIMDSDMTITANFSPISQTNYSLTIDVKGSGSVTPSEGIHSYSDGEIVTIVATPNSGWRFDGWTGDVKDSKSSTTEVNIDSSKIITANFVKPSPAWLLPLIIIATLTLVGIGVWYYLKRRKSPETKTVPATSRHKADKKPKKRRKNR